MEDGNNFNLVPENQEEQFNVEFGEVITLGGGGTNDFNQLSNRPSYDNQTMTGTTNIPKVPTKTSELINDGSNGESTYIEANGLATVATSGSYSDLNGTPTIPTVNDATLTITQNGTSKGTFTANDSDDTTIEVTDTTYSAFTGTDGNTPGTSGLVPAPATTDAGKFLKADGTWDTAGGGSGPTVVQTTGTSQTDVMSQNATTGMIYADPANRFKVQIGASATASSVGSIAIGSNVISSAGNSAIAIGVGVASASGAISIGHHGGSNAGAKYKGSIALGAYAHTSEVGEMNIGTTDTTYGYNSTNYRLLSGVHDGQTANDAVTVGQVNAMIDAINTATGSSIPHIGSST